MPLPTKAWTFLVYLAGDNNLDGAGVTDLLEMKQVGSNAALNLVAQFDRIGDQHQTLRYLLQKDTALAADVVGTLGETNTGDPAVLKDFVNWAVTEYPAERFALVLWNHGAGWDDTNVYAVAQADARRSVTHHGETVAAAATPVSTSTVSTGHLRAITFSRKRRALFRSTIEASINSRAIAFDDNAHDFLDNLELKRVLTAIKRKLKRPIDLLGMDACLMTMVEVAYQLRGTAQVLVGSEETEPGDGWPYHTLLADLAQNPKLNAQQLGKRIVKRYLASYPASEAVTQSACDMQHIPAVAAAISTLASALRQHGSDPAVALGLYQARQRVQSYSVPEYIDVADLCTQIKRTITQPEVMTACDTLLAAIKTSVLANGYRHKSMARSKGLSIYYPAVAPSPLYNKLDFAKHGQWDELINHPPGLG